MLDKIRENRDVLDRNDKDELVYENKLINGSHVVDLINDMLRRHKRFEWMVGVCEGTGLNECTRKSSA